MSETKKRIGFILASIHTGSAIHLWPALARAVRKTSAALFIFPGGRLDARADYEYLRNSVYKLVNPQNLDSVISWGSSLGGTADLEELNEFHRKLEPLPYVTIAHKMNGRGCVHFDAYTGMKSLVRHFITVHGARKIAFIRGPENHSSALDRYQAYRDALREAKIAEKPELISSPFPWQGGLGAILELCEKRGLTPGTDFDTLITSSDLLALPAVEYLRDRGFSVPETVRVGGFNNSAESRVFSVPLTTVHMPYGELGVTALGLLDSAQNGFERVLPAALVIRESCGCTGLRSFFERNEKNADKRTAGSTKEDVLFDSLCVELESLFHSSAKKSGIRSLLSALRARDTSRFFKLAENMLSLYFEHDNDISTLCTAIRLARNCFLFPDGYLQSLESRFFALAAHIQSHENACRQFRTARLHSVLDSLKTALLTSRSRKNLVELMAQYFPKAGIDCAALTLYETDDTSRLLGGFSVSGGETAFFASDKPFQSSLLLPDTLCGYFAEGVFMVQPLFMENQPLGALVCSVPVTDGAFFEEIRSALSSALKGIFLFEEMSLAKQRAEAAEKSQSEFFANIGTDLCDPLDEITNKITQIEQAMENGHTDADLLLPQMIFLKTAVREQREKTNLLIDVTLSQLHELPMEKRVFRINDALPQDLLKCIEEVALKLADFPLLYGDPQRLLQAFSFLCADFIPDPANPAVLEEDCVRFTFLPRRGYGESLWKKSELILAEHIFLLQHGEVRKQKCDTNGSCIVRFPFPSLACLPAVAVANEKSPVFYADLASSEDWEKLYEQRASALFRAPVRVFARSWTSRTFLEEIEKHLPSSAAPLFLFVGEKHRYPLWTENARLVAIPSMETYELALEKHSPSLVVLGCADCEAAAHVRRTRKTVLTPILVLPVTVTDEDAVMRLSGFQRLIICNRAVAESAEFASRVRSLLSGGDMLPPHTGALVKKAILYLNRHADSQVTRWKMADAVNVSEDYLTRVFHRETGLSPWEYLNRCRIFKASELLLHTGKTLYEIALEAGFQDQAYFCRVFKKITGMPPGQFRDPNKGK